MASSKSSASSGSSGTPGHPPVPTSWLILFAALLTVPWIIVGALYARGSTADNETAAEPEAAATVGGAGTRGKLTTSPIIVSPPLEYIPAEAAPARGVAWHLPRTDAATAASLLAWSGMPQADATRLLSGARPDPATNGLTLLPDAALIRGLSPEVRARLYLQLAKSRRNSAQAESFRFLGSSADEWFAGSPIAAATRQLVEPLLYRDGPFLHFADLETVRAEIPDEREYRLLLKALMRTRTLIARLQVGSASEVNALAQYWGVRGRRLDIRPLLESVAGAADDRSIDVIHLLPTLARNHLYRYPKLTAADLDAPLLANCLWTALNFFELEPDDRFLDVEAALGTLRTDYYVVEDGFALGDVVLFLDETGGVYHAAVYLADGLAFTKNGTSPMAPWTIMSIDNIRAFYNVRSAAPRLIYHRRKDL